MDKNARMWLFITMFPFFIGVFIQVLVPLQFIMGSSDKIDSAYNSYKMQVQQSTIRSLSFLNSKVLESPQQFLQNLQSTIIRQLIQNDQYQAIDTSKIILNNAYEISNMDADALQQVNLDRSMWYSAKKTSVAELSGDTELLYTKYARVQPFIVSILQNVKKMFSGMVYVKTTLVQGNASMVFTYPSAQNKDYKMLNQNLFSHSYNLTVQSYIEQGKNAIFIKTEQGTVLQLCVAIIQNSLLSGVMCLANKIDTVVDGFIKTLAISEIMLSSNEYYFLRPLYKFEDNSLPQIIGQFSYTGQGYNSTPSEEYFNIAQFNLSPNLYQGNNDYKLNVYRTDYSKTIYSIPLMLANYLGQYEILLYLVIVNNFETVKIQEDNYRNSIMIGIIVPASIIFIVSITVTFFLMRWLLKQLQKIMNNLMDYCLLIIKGDLKLNILNCHQSEDIRSLYNQFEVLNQLSKYSDPKYFDVPKPERIILYLEAYALFSKYDYNISNLCQNIADCYIALGEIPKAIQQIRKAIDIDIKNLQTHSVNLNSVFEKKLDSKNKINNRVKEKEKILSRKVRKLAHYLYAGFKPGDTQSSKLVSESTETLRKLIYPRVLNLQYIGAIVIEMRYKLRDRDFTNLEQNLDRLNNLIEGYEEKHRDYDEDCNAPPDVIRSYWCFMSAICKMKDRKMLEAYNLYVRGLYGDYFNPVLHTYTMGELKRILDIFKLDTACLSSFKFLEQQRPRTEREYVIMVDVSNPEMSLEEMKQWKKQNRQTADFIFSKYVKAEDRISINEFCTSVKVGCNLIEKADQDKILRKELMGAFKCRDKPVYSQVLPNLQRVLDRIRNLQSDKYIIMFLKAGLMLDGRHIAETLQGLTNTTLIILTDDISTVTGRGEQFYVLEFSNTRDISRLLSQKIVNQADNSVYIF